MGSIDVDLQGHVAISTNKRHLLLFLYTDLGRPSGATRLKRAVIYFVDGGSIKRSIHE